MGGVKNGRSTVYNVGLAAGLIVSVSISLPAYLLLVYSHCNDS